jgi:hypothetical protein
MLEIIEDILKDDFVTYSKVYELAGRRGVKKSEVKQAKELLGVKTVTLENKDERIWLWYIPRNIWKKYAG